MANWRLSIAANSSELRMLCCETLTHPGPTSRPTLSSKHWAARKHLIAEAAEVAEAAEAEARQVPAAAVQPFRSSTTEMPDTRPTDSPILPGDTKLITATPQLEMGPTFPHGHSTWNLDTTKSPQHGSPTPTEPPMLHSQSTMATQSSGKETSIKRSHQTTSTRVALRGKKSPRSQSREQLSP